VSQVSNYSTLNRLRRLLTYLPSSCGAAGNFLAPMSQLSPNAFKSVIDIDVLGTYNTMKAGLPHLVKSAAKHKSNGIEPSSTGTGGRVISISATFHYTGSQLQTHVVAAKAAVDGISANVAIEYGPLGVTSNVITPGPIAGTEGMERLSTANDQTAKQPAIPLGRWGTVKDIADATVFLFSDAGNYINGEVLVVDGGDWRVRRGIEAFAYPDFVLSGQTVTGVAGGKKPKI